MLYSITPNRLRVKSPHKADELERLRLFFHRAQVRTASVITVASVALSSAQPGGEITERQLCELTGYALSTVRLACRRLVGLGVLAPVAKPRGRGYLKSYRVVWGKEGSFSVHKGDFAKSRRTKNINIKTQSKDRPSSVRSRGGMYALKGGEGSVHSQNEAQAPSNVSPPKRKSTTDYVGDVARQVTLTLGARFYRSVMKETRLGLESWALGESVRHALEGLVGNRIDGMSLAGARELIARVWAMRAEIERLAASGASPRRVCSFVAGRLAGVPERRSKREVLRRTAELIKNNHALLDARIAGLKRFEAEREREYRDGVACGRCGYTHSEIEYRSGYRDDGTGTLNCFGFARVKLQELREALYLLKRKEQRCTVCGGSLIGGNINGVCWTCHDTGRSDGQATLQENDAALAPSWGEITKLCTVCLRAQATAYGMCTRCRKLMVRSRYH